jgi:hypothetical protein
VSEQNKAMVRRMVEGINAGDIEATVDELFAPATPAARRVKRLFAEFLHAFPAEERGQAMSHYTSQI